MTTGKTIGRLRAQKAPILTSVKARRSLLVWLGLLAWNGYPGPRHIASSAGMGDSPRSRDGVKSFHVQCAWAAGTIKRRYTGNLVAFGKRYNPLNAKQWSKNIAQIIARLKRHHRGILPAPSQQSAGIGRLDLVDTNGN